MNSPEINDYSSSPHASSPSDASVPLSFYDGLLDASTGNIIDTDARCVRLAAAALNILAEYSDGGDIELLSPSGAQSVAHVSTSGNTNVSLLPTGDVFKRLRESVAGMPRYLLAKSSDKSSEIYTDSVKSEYDDNSVSLASMPWDPSQVLWDAITQRPPCRWQKFSAVVEVAKVDDSKSKDSTDESSAVKSRKVDEIVSVRFLKSVPEICQSSDGSEFSLSLKKNEREFINGSNTSTIPVDVIVDIAHNPPAIAALARRIKREFGDPDNMNQITNIQ